MARPKTVSDDEIRRAAREVFVEHGPQASVTLVADRLGVSHTAVFSRCGSKAGLMLDALCPGRPAAVEQLLEDPPDSAVADRLVEILMPLMQFFRRVVPNLVVLRAAGLDPGGPPNAEPPPVMLRRMLSGWLMSAMASGAVARLDPDAVAEGLLGAMEARCFNAYLGGAAYAPGEDHAFLSSLVVAFVSEGPS